MLESSNVVTGIPEVAELDVLILWPSDSRIALDIAAVSPFLSASNMRNFLTDCSIDTHLSCPTEVAGREGW
jgi:hypothetical protein